VHRRQLGDRGRGFGGACLGGAFGRGVGRRLAGGLVGGFGGRRFVGGFRRGRAGVSRFGRGRGGRRRVGGGRRIGGLVATGGEGEDEQQGQQSLHGAGTPGFGRLPDHGRQAKVHRGGPGPPRSGVSLPRWRRPGPRP